MNTLIFQKSIKVMLDDLDETFTSESPGYIVSNSRRVIQIEGQEEEIVTDIRQTIEFVPVCKSFSGGQSSNLKSSRNYIVFDKKEGVARFALTSSISSSDEDSPCNDFNCNRFSYCILDEDKQPNCECLKGFTSFGRNGCADIDECSSGQHNCSPDAECINTNGNFICKCKTGFTGDGTSCELKVTCDTLKCDVNAECILGFGGQAVCQCLHGYHGDGTTCQPFPTHLGFRGASLVDSLFIDPNLYPVVAASVKEIGPTIEHSYEIENKGPHAVRNVQLKVRWPLKDKDGNYLTYLYEEPQIKVYFNGIETTSDACTMENQGSINPRRLPRQVDFYAGEEYNQEDDDDNDYYADNVGVVVSNKEYVEEYYDELSSEEREILKSYDLPDYDYSHFDHLNQNPKPGLPINSSLLEEVSLQHPEGFSSSECTFNLAPKVHHDLLFMSYTY